jgi:hypothetical protein
MPWDDAPIAALAEVLCRTYLDGGRRGDAETARRLLLAVAAQDVAADLIDAAVGGVWAGFRSDEELADELVKIAAGSAHRLLPTALDDSARLLVSVSLALLAKRGATEEPARDLVAVAISAQRIDQDKVGRAAAEQALSARAALTPSQEAAASLVLALVTQDRADILRAYELVERLPPDDPRVCWAESVRATLHPDGAGTLSEAGDAIRVGDRRTAAASLARDFARTYDETGNPLVLGIRDTMSALAHPDVDVEAARRSLIHVVGLLRKRQRYGQIPPVVKAGIDMATDLLHVDATPETADLLVELMEALADAGLSEVSLGGEADQVPALVQAVLAEAAARHPVWPDLRACVDGLRGRPALLLRRQRMLSAQHGSVLGMYVQPPDAVAIKSTLMKPADAAVLVDLGSGSPARVSSVTIDDIDRLIRTMMPRALAERIAAGEVPSLLIVPDGELWSVPWQASTLLTSTAVSLAPSMSVYAQLPPFDGAVRSVTAFVDEDAPFADLVVAALEEAAAAGRLVVSRHSAARPSDLLLVYAHGAGAGLDFSAGPAAWPISALRLATAAETRAALVAACWSVAAPPVSFPINLPAAMMLKRVSSVVGGLWPLPAASTARIVADVIAGLAAGEPLVCALAHARSRAPDGLVERWGLAVHGIA